MFSAAEIAEFLACEFLEAKSTSDVKTFENFVVAVSAGVDAADYWAVIVWCETFGQFITAASYR
jgi:hypothetical protein